MQDFSVGKYDHDLIKVDDKSLECPGFGRGQLKLGMAWSHSTQAIKQALFQCQKSLHQLLSL